MTLRLAKTVGTYLADLRRNAERPLRGRQRDAGTDDTTEDPPSS